MCPNAALFFLLFLAAPTPRHGPSLVVKRQGRDRPAGWPHYARLDATTSPDGKLFASCGSPPFGAGHGEVYREGVLAVKDVKAGKQLWKVRWEEGAFLALAFSADSKWLAAGGGEEFAGGWAYCGDVRVWEARTGKLRYRLRWADRRVVECLAFSPDGKALVSGGQDGVVRWWDAATGEERGRLKVRRERTGGPVRVRQLEFSPDGRLLAVGAGGWRSTPPMRTGPGPSPSATGAGNWGRAPWPTAWWGEVWLLDARTRKRLAVVLKGHDKGIAGLTFAAGKGHHLLVVADTGGVVKRWELSWKK